MGILGVLTVIFVVAKLVGLTDWSWWLVFSPMLAGAALATALIVFSIIAGIVSNDK